MISAYYLPFVFIRRGQVAAKWKKAKKKWFWLCLYSIQCIFLFNFIVKIQSEQYLVYAVATFAVKPCLPISSLSAAADAAWCWNRCISLLSVARERQGASANRDAIWIGGDMTFGKINAPQQSQNRVKVLLNSIQPANLRDSSPPNGSRRGLLVGACAAMCKYVTVRMCLAVCGATAVVEGF
jgi:hypothetical protein